MKKTTKLLSIYDIAGKLNPPRTAAAVDTALKRLKEEPKHVTRSNYRYFDPSVVQILQQTMRGPNRSLVKS